MTFNNETSCSGADLGRNQRAQDQYCTPVPMCHAEFWVRVIEKADSEKPSGTVVLDDTEGNAVGR
jgi:hypothetical protein